MSLNRRELLAWGAAGAGAALFSSAAARAAISQTEYSPPPVDRWAAPLAAAPQAPAGINPLLFQRAKFALDQHRIAARDHIGIVDFGLASRDPRFHVVNLMSGAVETCRVTHGKGSDPAIAATCRNFRTLPDRKPRRTAPMSPANITTANTAFRCVWTASTGPTTMPVAGDRHSQRLVCRARRRRHARQARPLTGLLRLQPPRPVEDDGKACRRADDFRRQIRLIPSD
jgi:hypothetical protein